MAIVHHQATAEMARARGLCERAAVRCTSLRPVAGLYPGIVADIIASELARHAYLDVTVDARDGGVWVEGVEPADLLGPMRAAAQRYREAYERFGRALEGVSLETAEADARLMLWSEAGMRHEQVLIVLDQLHEHSDWGGGRSVL